MRKEILFFLVVALLIGIGFALVSGLEGYNKVDEKVIESLKSESKINVMVYLEDSIGVLDTNLKNKIERDFGGVVSMEVSSAELDMLVKSSGVSEVRQERTFRIFLLDSVKIVNATRIWPFQINGMNLTGLGQTVCITDTGVNYTHRDLGGCTNESFLAGNCTKVLGGWDFVNDDNNPADDHGHGTHVSGIVAANGTVKGIAPGSKIVALKVCDSGGNCDEGDVASAIDWCTGNSSLYNISVISMSLGGGLYTNYCDDGSAINLAINRAVAKNISVVVATGNGGSSSQISFPACIRNSTRVGSVDKSGVISGSSNRNNLTLLFAPGVSITSTWFDGGYYSDSGTSMATPMVSGAIAIMNELLSLKNRTLAPRDSELVLNSTGRMIGDSSSGLNFSIINVYNAVVYFIKPNVTLSPSNNAYTNNSNFNFTCNLSVDSDYSLVNMSFYLWNATNNLIYNETRNITGTTNSSEFNYTLSNESRHYWNCMATSNVSIISYADSNHSLTYDITAPNVSLNSPANASSYTGSQTLIFGYNASDNFNISRCDLIVNSAVVASNSSVIDMNATNNISYSIGAGSYVWNISCVDFAGNSNVSETRTLTINSDGGGGGGGGGGSSRVVVNTTQSNLTITNVTIRNVTFTNASVKNESSNATKAGAGTTENRANPEDKKREGMLHIFEDGQGAEKIKGILLGVSEAIKNNVGLFILSVTLIVGVGIAIGYFMRTRTGVRINLKRIRRK